MSTNMPDRELAASFRTAINKEEQGVRRNVVLYLATDLLRKLNPSISGERIRDLFFAFGDVLTEPYESIHRTMRANFKRDEMQGWESALDIARFYWANTDLTVPAQAVILTSSHSPNQGRTPGEKDLVYIDDWQTKMRGRINLVFTTSPRVGFAGLRKIKTEQPDVYLGDISGSPAIDDFSIQGVDKSNNWWKSKGSWNDIWTLWR